MLHDPSMRLLASAAGADEDAAADAGLLVSDGAALLPSAGPAGTVPAGGALSSGGTISRYTVKDGDTLSGIAQTFGISVNTLLWANDLASGSVVRPGTELIILPVSGIRHTVARGDTLSSLAKRYGADESDIASFNGIGTAAELAAGDEIIIPGGEPATPAKAKTEVKRAVTKAARSGSGAASGGSSGFFSHPVPGALLTQSIHGWNAVDLGAPSGTPIYAAAAGTVIVSKVGGYNGGYGNYIVIDHGRGIQTLYSHLATDLVTVGQRVEAGERIGTVGITGAATGYHLHFEVRGAKNPFAGCAAMSRCSI